MNRYADQAKLAELKTKANRLPLTPGVYIMKDKNGVIIYIGKAKALKNRVTQYFGSGNQHTEKVKRMVSNVEDFEYILCDSEFEALILENSLIKQNQPKYNILLKDDKGYSYIKITDEKWKKLTTAKSTDGKGSFIGPYTSHYVVRETVDEARKFLNCPIAQGTLISRQSRVLIIISGCVMPRAEVKCLLTNILSRFLRRLNLLNTVTVTATRRNE